MAWIQKTLDINEKLSVLSHDSQYDLACSCSINDDDRRHRSKEDKWIYPVTFPNGGRSFLFKTLISNVCVNDCKYCPLREGQNTRRCTLQAYELVKAFLQYYQKGKVMGLFLSSGVMGNPDKTMEQINKIALILRKKHFKGYIHLKVIPGASNAAIEETVSLASAVSINIETAGEKNFNQLSNSKNYLQDIIRPLKLISRLTGKGSRYSRVKKTTQFVVGASEETDQEIIKYSWNLYRRLGLNRIYFSAYQRGLGEPDLPGEISGQSNNDILTREHRLYQADWLIRKYGFTEKEILFQADGNLSLTLDPKETWAKNHPEFFPVDINKADKLKLLRVPGLGLVTVNYILKYREKGGYIRYLENLGKLGKRLIKAKQYLKI